MGLGIDANNLLQKKHALLEIVQREGPCLPSAISGRVGLQLMMASALLSELRADKSLKISNLKIGGSPLYYVDGQETKLENFIHHLPGKEKEAFEIIKKEEVLDEAPLEPAHRIALRNLKDFAFHLTLKTDNGDRIFWHFHTVKEEDAKLRIEEMIKREAKKEAPIEKEKEKVKEEISPKEEEVKEEKKIEERVKSHEPVIKEEKIEKPKSKPRKKTVHKKDFADKVLDHVNKKEMQVIKNFEDDGNKICIAQMESKVGALKFLVFGMDKKALSESDLSFAFSEGQQERLPVLLVTSGKLTKKAEEYLKKLGDYVVINKV